MVNLLENNYTNLYLLYITVKQIFIINYYVKHSVIKYIIINVKGVIAF